MKTSEFIKHLEEIAKTVGEKEISFEKSDGTMKSPVPYYSRRHDRIMLDI